MIIIVDNASVDNSLEQLPTDDRISIIHNNENKGFAFACNQGITLCKSEYVVMLNPDVMLQSDTLILSYQFMNNHKDVSIMGCKQLNDIGQVQPSCSRFPEPKRFWNDALGLSKISPSCFKPASLMTDWDHKNSGFVDQIIGSYMFIRSRIFQQIGCFDTRFFVYYEELDFSKRLADSGGLSFYNHAIELVHTCNGTTEGVKAFRLFLSLNSRLIYAQKHFGTSGRMSTYIVTIFVEPFTRMLFSLLKGGREDAANTLNGYTMLWRKWVLGKKTFGEQTR